MGKLGNVKVKGLEEFQKNLAKLQKPEDFVESCAKELAARLLAKVIKRTPVGDYSEEITVIAKRDGKKHKKGEEYKKRVNKDGKRGGTLRRGWTTQKNRSGAEGLKTRGARQYVDSIKVNYYDGYYVIEITNPVSYASYVESGHRQTPGRFVPALGKQLKRGWVRGKFMMKYSVQELESIAPKVLESKIKKYLEECMQ